jgi:hypothetical protein
VAQDDLNVPLGQDAGPGKRKKASRLPAAAPQVLAGTLGLFGIAVVVWAIFVNDPLGGEPMAVVATTPPMAKQAAIEDSDGKQHARHDGSAEKKAVPIVAAVPGMAATPPGGKTVTIIDGSSGKRQDVMIPGNANAGTAEAPVDPRLIEASRHGPIPKVGADGARAFTVYAQPIKLPASKTDAPRIAIVIGGMGISASGTADAMAKLPAPVTFAIAPYGADLAQLAARVRADKHELLLQAPMEPFDYPDNDPGPQTLLTSLSAEQNIDRLHWLMSRFGGYVGIVSFMGGRFTAAEQALAPVLRETAKRGLIFMDDGSSSRSVAAQLAGSHNLPFAKADVVIDAVPTPVEIGRALARLEMIARDRGNAVGIATALPATVTRIAEWAKTVEAKGIVLVPITMVANKPKSS